jgi:rhomboid protease GluP
LVSVGYIGLIDKGCSWFQMSSTSSRVQEYLSTIPLVTKVLLFINVTVHALIFVSSFNINDLAINPALIIVRGEYYRVISSAFVHGGILHIAMNMSSLVALGPALEFKYGSLKMALLTFWAIFIEGFLFVSFIW